MPLGDIGGGSFEGEGASGSFRLVNDGELVHLEMSDFQTDIEGVANVIGALRTVPDTQTCFDSGVRLGLGTYEAGIPSGPLFIYVGDMLSDDPTAVKQIVITESLSGDPQNCLQRPVAIADIDWTIEPQRGSIRAVDSGETGGARGVVETVDGAPSTYTVVSDDLLDEVTARFGLSEGDLFYLNPSRSPAPASPTLRVGEVLNLRLENR